MPKSTKQIIRTPAFSLFNYSFGEVRTVIQSADRRKVTMSRRPAFWRRK